MQSKKAVRCRSTDTHKHPGAAVPSPAKFSSLPILRSYSSHTICPPKPGFLQPKHSVRLIESLCSACTPILSLYNTEPKAPIRQGLGGGSLSSISRKGWQKRMLSRVRRVLQLSSCNRPPLLRRHPPRVVPSITCSVSGLDVESAPRVPSSFM